MELQKVPEIILAVIHFMDLYVKDFSHQDFHEICIMIFWMETREGNLSQR